MTGQGGDYTTSKEKIAWLRAASRAGVRLDGAARRLAEVREAAASTHQQWEAGKVSTSNGGDRAMTATVSRIEAAERAVSRVAEEYTSYVRTIDAAVSKLPTDRAEVLRRRYFGRQTWQQIADGMQKSVRWVQILHGRALQKLMHPSETDGNAPVIASSAEGE